MKGLFIYYTSSLFSGLSYNHEWSFFQQMKLFFTMALQGLLLVQFHQQFVTQLMY